MKSTAMVKIALTGLTGLALFSMPALAHEGGHQHYGDIGIEVENGKLIVGLLGNHDGHEHLDTSVKVFQSEIDEVEIGVFKFFNSTSPGFDFEDGILPGNSLFGFNILQPLLYWTGSGFSGAAGETMTILDSGSGQEATTGAGQVSGFKLAVDDEGGYHGHFTYFLNPASGQIAPASGIYLLHLYLYSDALGADMGDAFAIVFNWDSSEEMHEDAIAYANANVVPEPSSLVALAAGALSFIAIRRRH